MKNIEIREKLKSEKIKQYELANFMGVSRYTFSVWLSLELPEEKKAKIMKAIEEYKNK